MALDNNSFTFLSKDSNDFADIETSILTVLRPMYWTLACVIVCANGALLLLYLRDATVRAYLNYFLVSQIVTDALVGLVAIPLVLIFPHQRLLGQTDVEDVACILALVLQLSFFSMVPWGDAIIAVDRLVAVMRPFRYKFIITKRRSALALMCVWGFVLFFHMLPAMNLESVGGDKWRSYCSGHYRYPIAYLYTMTFLLLAAPILLTSVCYVTMYVVIKRKHRQNLVGAHPSLPKTIKAAKTCLIKAFFLGFGWLPYIGFLTVLSVFQGVSSKFKFNALCISFLFAAAVSAANPLVYSLRSGTVKMAFKRAINHRFREARRGSVLPQRIQADSSVVITQMARYPGAKPMAKDDQQLTLNVPVPFKPRLATIAW